MVASSSEYFTQKQEGEGAQREMVEPSTTVGSGELYFIAKGASCNKTEDSLGADITPNSSSSEYFSTWIRTLIESKSKFSSDLQADIATSKDHWIEIESSKDAEDLAENNLKAFRRLQQEYRDGDLFFRDWDDYNMKLSRKIAEGGQAEIFEAAGDVNSGGYFLLKVFKEGSSLEYLQKQWPLIGMFRLRVVQGILKEQRMPYYTGAIYSGTLLKNGRFAFMMRKYWGDLRKLIDRRMQNNHYQSPPFAEDVAYKCMFEIANGMAGLHENGVIHRDLKAANVLIDGYINYKYTVKQEDFDPLELARSRGFICKVADYESSIGIVGTGFWRAPEILLGVKNRNVQPNLFTPKADVYSYAMTCYEILTGRMPFEKFRFSNYDVVLCGKRLELPKIIIPWLKKMLISCWQ